MHKQLISQLTNNIQLKNFVFVKKKKNLLKPLHPFTKTISDIQQNHLLTKVSVQEAEEIIVNKNTPLILHSFG